MDQGMNPLTTAMEAFHDKNATEAHIYRLLHPSPFASKLERAIMAAHSAIAHAEYYTRCLKRGHIEPLDPKIFTN